MSSSNHTNDIVIGVSVVALSVCLVGLVIGHLAMGAIGGGLGLAGAGFVLHRTVFGNLRQRLHTRLSWLWTTTPVDWQLQDLGPVFDELIEVDGGVELRLSRVSRRTLLEFGQRAPLPTGLHALRDRFVAERAMTFRADGVSLVFLADDPWPTRRELEDLTRLLAGYVLPSPPKAVLNWDRSVPAAVRLAQAAARWSVESAEARLVPLLRHRDPAVVVHAAAALEKLGTRDVIGPLEALRRGPYAAVAERALIAIQRRAARVTSGGLALAEADVGALTVTEASARRARDDREAEWRRAPSAARSPRQAE